MTHSATRGPALRRSTPLKSQSSPGNSSGLKKKEEEECVRAAVCRVDIPNMHKITCAHTHAEGAEKHMYGNARHAAGVGTCVFYNIQTVGSVMFSFLYLKRKILVY